MTRWLSKTQIFTTTQIESTDAKDHENNVFKIIKIFFTCHVIFSKKRDKNSEKKGMRAVSAAEYEKIFERASSYFFISYLMTVRACR